MRISDTEAARQIVELIEHADLDTLVAIYAAAFGCQCWPDIDENREWVLNVGAA